MHTVVEGNINHLQIVQRNSKHASEIELKQEIWMKMCLSDCHVRARSNGSWVPRVKHLLPNLQAVCILGYHSAHTFILGQATVLAWIF